jgi:proteasome accessory factor B
MCARYQDRIARLRVLEQCLPPNRSSSVEELLGRLGNVYPSASKQAHRRALQRDLKELIGQGRVAMADGRPPRYRRQVADTEEDDAAIWQWTLDEVRLLAAEAVRERRLDQLWQTLLTNREGPRLDASRLRVVSDGFQLPPADLYTEVLSAVIQALMRRCALSVRYKDDAGARCKVILHAHALVARGSIAYLLALKNDDAAEVGFYPLHRMIRADVLPKVTARRASDFDLDRLITEGPVDFAQGELIELELRVRADLVELLRRCPMAPDQRVEDEPADSDFELRVRAQVPSTGQLRRWLLSAGDSLEVVSPPDLRRDIAAQTLNTAKLYLAP